MLFNLLYVTFSFDDSTATGSKSTPTDNFAPNLAAAIVNIPEPHPTSNTVASSFTYLSNACMHILVVS